VVEATGNYVAELVLGGSRGPCYCLGLRFLDATASRSRARTGSDPSWHIRFSLLRL